MAAGYLELQHLARALSRPWHCGTPANALAVGCAVGAVALSAAMLWRMVGGRPVPLRWSVAMVAAFAGALAATSWQPCQRTAAGANLVALEQARALHARLNAQLQRSARVPQPFEGEVWQLDGPSPFRGRGLLAEPWRLALSESATAASAPLVPGTLLVWVSTDAASFALWVVGVDGEGQAVRVTDDEGALVVLRGAVNPEGEG